MSFFRAVGGLVTDCVRSVVGSYTPEEQIKEKLQAFAAPMPADQKPIAAHHFCIWLLTYFTQPEDDPQINYVPGYSYRINTEKLGHLTRILETEPLTSLLFLRNYYLIYQILNDHYATAKEKFEWFTSLENSRITVEDMKHMKIYVETYHNISRLLEILTAAIKSMPANLHNYFPTLEELEKYKQHLEELNLFKKLGQNACSSSNGSLLSIPDAEELIAPDCKFEFLGCPCGISYFGNTSPPPMSPPHFNPPHERANKAGATIFQQPGSPPSAKDMAPNPNEFRGDVVSLLRIHGYRITWISQPGSSDTDADKLGAFCNDIGLNTLQQIFDRGVFNKPLLADYIINYIKKFKLRKFDVVAIPPPPPPTPPTILDKLKDMVVYKV